MMRDFCVNSSNGFMMTKARCWFWPQKDAVPFLPHQVHVEQVHVEDETQHSQLQVITSIRC